jgi:hypothetical protein
LNQEIKYYFSIQYRKHKCGRLLNTHLDIIIESFEERINFIKNLPVLVLYEDRIEDAELASTQSGIPLEEKHLLNTELEKMQRLETDVENRIPLFRELVAVEVCEVRGLQIINERCYSRNFKDSGK